MTDKEQIIIDGVDVSGCRFLEPDLTCYATAIYTIGATTDEPCNDCTDCYFKQLVRKTQKCEELKEKYKWYDHYKDSALLNKKLCDKASDERARYRKALEKIEEFIEEEDWSILDYVFKRIKDIISKAKGEGE